MQTTEQVSAGMTSDSLTSEDAQRRDAIRARVRRSLDDPRRDLTGAEVDAALNALFETTKEDADRD